MPSQRKKIAKRKEGILMMVLIYKKKEKKKKGLFCQESLLLTRNMYKRIICIYYKHYIHLYKYMYI